MDKECIVFENDKCYVDTPVYPLNDYCYPLNDYCANYQRRLIMTKEAFVECYNRWIKGEDENDTTISQTKNS